MGIYKEPEINGGVQMSIINEQRGQGGGIIYAIMGAVMGAIILAAMMPVLNSVIGTVISSNMSSFSNSATIIMLLGMTGLLVVIGYLYGIIRDVMNPPTQGGF